MANPANRIRARDHVREWNQHFPSGTKVVFEGNEKITDSPAALGKKDEPVVFIQGIEEPVPWIGWKYPAGSGPTRRGIRGHHEEDRSPMLRQSR